MPHELPADSANVADFQHGVLSRVQALQSGMSAARVSWRLRGGHWQRLHRGVYATFHRISRIVRPVSGRRCAGQARMRC